MPGPSGTQRLPEKVKAIVRGGPAPVGIFPVHNAGLLWREFPMTRRPSGGQAGFEPVGWRRPLTMRDAILGRALAGDGGMFPLHPGIARVM
jgi:hypothetical protein